MLAAWLLGACASSPPGPPPLVQVAGCRGTPGGACAVAPGDVLTIWTDRAAARPRGGELAAEPLLVDGGATWRVRVPPPPARLTVEAPGAAPWMLDLVPPPDGPADAASRRALDAMARGLPGADALLAEAARAQEAAGNALAAHTDRMRLAYRWFTRPGGLLQAAQAWREAHAALREPPLVWNLDALYNDAYTGGALALARMAMPAAERLLAAAERHARRADDALDLERVQDLRARQLLQVGRFEEAIALRSRLLARAGGAPACEQVVRRNNLAWAVIVARLEDAIPRDAGPDPLRLLREAEALLGPGGCEVDVARRRANIAFNRVLAGGGRDDATLAALAAIPVLQAGLDAWETWLSVQVLSSLGRDEEAMEALDDLEARAENEGDDDMLLRACSFRPVLAERLQGPADALAAIEDCLESARLVAVEALLPTADRGTFLDRTGGLVARQVRLLLDADRPGEALDAFRRHRRRYLASLLPAPDPAVGERLAARYRALRSRMASIRAAEDWTTPADARARARLEREAVQRELLSVLEAAGLGLARDPRLRAPDPGELLLAWMPLDDGWWGLARLDGRTRARPIAADPLEHPGALLSPFPDLVDEAARVTLLPYGPLHDLDLEAIPVDGQPLALRRPTVRSLDLPPEGPPRGATRTALVVADPRDDLPRARQEARRAARALEAAGWTVRLLVGKAASWDAVSSAMPGVDRLHYAGHATAGGSGWDAALLLAAGQRLMASDLLAPGLRGAAPRTAILSACEAASSDPTDVAGLGLAQAFVLAGSELVVAPRRPVSDELAAAFAALLPAGDGRLDAGTVHIALQRLAASRPRGDWAAYRMIVP